MLTLIIFTLMFSGGSVGKILIFAGVLVIIAGIVILLIEKTNFPLFRLPGDIVIKKKNFTFYFPIVTSILLSILISLVLYIISRIK